MLKRGRQRSEGRVLALAVGWKRMAEEKKGISMLFQKKKCVAAGIRAQVSEPTTWNSHH